MREEPSRERDLIEDYQEYLSRKRLLEMNLESRSKDQDPVDSGLFTYDLERFDLASSRQKVRELF